MTEFAVATANTHMGEMLRHPDGMRPFQDKGIDLIGMQEVLGFERDELEDRLGLANYQLAVFHPKSGLAIARAGKSQLEYALDSTKVQVIHAIGKVGTLAQSWDYDFAQRFRERALISASFSANDQMIHFATTHPIVFARPRSRAKQIVSIEQYFQGRNFGDDPILVAADWNSNPGARGIDQYLRTMLGMYSIQTLEPTYDVVNSKHGLWVKAAARLSSRPLASYNAHLDTVLFRNTILIDSDTLSIQSDHKAVYGRFVTTSAIT